MPKMRWQLFKMFEWFFGDGKGTLPANAVKQAQRDELTTRLEPP